MNKNTFLGLGSIKNLNSIIAKYKKILLVTGKKSFTKSNAQKILEPYLVNKNITHFYDFVVNPQLEDVKVGIALIHKIKPEIIIAIGGGSVMDMAKLINILSVQKNKNLVDVIKNNLIETEGLPLIAIPTTAGTGSEETHFAVVYVDRVKYALTNLIILPNYVIIDSIFIQNQPKNIAATTAMDALSQAIESYWAINTNEESKAYASQAIKLILPNIKKVVLTNEKKAQESLMLGANLAGKAINISKTTAPHAISYPITTYFNIPHGHAVALTLGEFFLINPENQSLYKLLGCCDAQSCKIMWYKLMQDIGLDNDFKKLKIYDISLIIDNVDLERLSNNPTFIDNKILKQLFSRLSVN